MSSRCKNPFLGPIGFAMAIEIPFFPGHRVETRRQPLGFSSPNLQMHRCGLKVPPFPIRKIFQKVSDQFHHPDPSIPSQHIASKLISSWRSSWRISLASPILIPVFLFHFHLGSWQLFRFIHLHLHQDEVRRRRRRRC